MLNRLGPNFQPTHPQLRMSKLRCHRCSSDKYVPRLALHRCDKCEAQWNIQMEVFTLLSTVIHSSLWLTKREYAMSTRNLEGSSP